MITEAEIDAAAAAIKLTSSPASSCRSWIACARAALEAAQNVRSDMPEIASPRAELVQTSKMLAEASEHWDKSMDAWEKAKAAGRQDAEEIARLKAALKPFAQAADEVDRYAEDRRLASTFENNLTVSHLRDARAACRPQGERSET